MSGWIPLFSDDDKESDSSDSKIDNITRREILAKLAENKSCCQ